MSATPRELADAVLDGHVRETESGALEATIKVKVGPNEESGWYVNGRPVDTAAGAGSVLAIVVRRMEQLSQRVRPVV